MNVSPLNFVMPPAPLASSVAAAAKPTIDPGPSGADIAGQGLEQLGSGLQDTLAGPLQVVGGLVEAGVGGAVALGQGIAGWLGGLFGPATPPLAAATPAPAPAATPTPTPTPVACAAPSPKGMVGRLDGELTRIGREELGRPPLRGEVAGWRAAALSQEATLDGVRAQIAASDEARLNHQYKTATGENLPATDRLYWMSRARNTHDTKVVLAELSKSLDILSTGSAG